METVWNRVYLWDLGFFRVAFGVIFILQQEINMNNQMEDEGDFTDIKNNQEYQKEEVIFIYEL